MEYLARSNPETVGVVGVGTQARTQLMGLAIQDAAAANIAYRKALEEKTGEQVKILNI